MTNDALEQFKLKVAEDLVYRAAWTLCDDDGVPSIKDGCELYDAIDKHVHLVADTDAMRRSRIEALRAELHALEQDQPR